MVILVIFIFLGIFVTKTLKNLFEKIALLILDFKKLNFKIK